MNETIHNTTEYFDIVVGLFRGIITPLLCIIGFIGNGFIIIIFSCETKMSRFSIYCITLAITHSLALFTNAFLDDFLGRGLSFITQHSQFVWKLDVYSNLSCKLMEYLPNSVYFASSTLVIIFAIDRLLTIYQPIKFFAAYYLNFAILVCSLCIISGFILNIPLFMSYNLVRDKVHSLFGWKYKCDMLVSSPGTEILSRFAIYNKVFGAFILPTFIVLLLNSLIIYKFLSLNNIKCFSFNENQLTHTNLRRNSTGIFFSKSQNQNHELSRIVGHIAVNSAFLLLTFPLVIVIILRIHSEYYVNLKQNMYYYNSLKHLSRLFSSVKDINYVSNFFIYLKFLPNFYKGFIKICQKVCPCYNTKKKFQQINMMVKCKNNNLINPKTSEKITVYVPRRISNLATRSNIITQKCHQTYDDKTLRRL